MKYTIITYLDGKYIRRAECSTDKVSALTAFLQSQGCEIQHVITAYIG